MPDVTLGGTTFVNLTGHNRTPFKVGATHTLMDGTFKQDVYNASLKYRWTLEWEYMTAADLATLQTKFAANTTHTFMDLDGSSNTVVFEDFQMPQDGRPEVEWTNRRYRVKIVVRTV